MIQKKKTEKSPKKPRPEKPHNVEHDEEPAEHAPSPEEKLDMIPEDDEFETPPYEEPPAGEGP